MTDSQPLLPLNTLISVCFALCLSWLLCIVIIYPFYLAITSPRKYWPSTLQKGNKGLLVLTRPLSPPPAWPGGVSGVVEKVPGSREAELNG